MKKNIILTIITIVIIGAGAFYAGIKYQENKQSSFRQFGNNQGARMGAGQTQRNRSSFRPISGEIINADDKSITVKLNDGSSKIVLFSNKTAINKASEATKSDLKNGKKVAVFGTENTDGSVTAQNIQLNPTLGFDRGPNRSN